jgi:hypothetical protein
MRAADRANYRIFRRGGSTASLPSALSSLQ